MTSPPIVSYYIHNRHSLANQFDDNEGASISRSAPPWQPAEKDQGAPARLYPQAATPITQHRLQGTLTHYEYWAVMSWFTSHMVVPM